jgi:hypothetical protein
VAFHAGDGSDAEREHLESCLACARTYRNLQGDMETLLTALRRSPISGAAASVDLGTPDWRRGMRLALAASVVVAAFAGGRITGLPTSDQAAVTAGGPAGGLGDQIAMAGDGARTPAGYGLYIDDLMDSDAGERDQQPAGQSDGDNQVDEDSGAF